MTEKDEHDICISCGFCCDRTLFDVAKLGEEEVLRDKFIDIETRVNDVRFFKLPCPYFDKKCTIYHEKKPDICSKFKCMLLRNAIKGEITKENAMRAIDNARTLRDEILDEYERLKGKRITFREVFVESFKNPEFDENQELKLLKYRANLLDILLTKHFKSDELFREFYEIID